MCKKTHEQFVEDVRRTHGDEYIVLSSYNGVSEKVRVKHIKCKNEYWVLPTNILNGRRCPECFGKKKYIYEFIKEFIENEGYKLFTPKEEYENNRTKLSLECPQGHKHVNDFKHFKKGVRCKICKNKEAGIKNRLKYEDVKQCLEELGYQLLGNYIKSNEKIHIKCQNGHESYALLPNLKKGQGCYFCGREKQNEKKRTPFEQIKGFFDANGCELLSKNYINFYELLEFKCYCGRIDIKNYANFLDCPMCSHCSSNSKGEAKIRKLLEENKINFVRQYKFKNCKNKHSLPFDFSILKDNNDISLLIEYDGQHHYAPVRFGGMSEEQAYENFINTQRNDKIKNEYCKNNSIPLLRIPYWEFDNIEEILRSNLNDMLLFIV